MLKLYISSFIGLIIVVWVLVLWVQGIPVSSDFFKPFGVVVVVITVFMAIFNKYIWHWKVLKGWYVKRPDIRGTWEVELESSWSDSETNKEMPTIYYGYMAIRQSWTSLSVRLMTQASKSEFIAHSIEEQEDRDLFRLVGVYRNEPKIEQRSVSEIHYGSFILDIHGSPVCEMQGHYWTDRGTKGA